MDTIKALRSAQTPKMSQEKLGSLVGVGRTAVAMWESGKSEPDNATLLKLSKIFNVTADYLLTGKNSPQEPPAEKEALSADELRLLKAYRAASGKRKEAVLDLLED